MVDVEAPLRIRGFGWVWAFGEEIVLSAAKAGCGKQVLYRTWTSVVEKAPSSTGKICTTEVLRLRATSAISRHQSVRRSAQDDDSVGELTERRPLCGNRGALQVPRLALGMTSGGWVTFIRGRQIGWTEKKRHVPLQKNEQLGRIFNHWVFQDL